MQCPIDGSDLVMTERQGIEIDYCPKCRGVWLDRGELDKIIERSTGTALAPPVQERRPEPRYREEDRGEYRPRKKKSLLGEIFDF
jgi:uncharacterized protein